MISNHLGPIIKQSKLYETAAWGVTNQANFVNQALVIKTILKPMALLEGIHLIEKKLGRQKGERWGPRIIDIDILFYGDEILKNEELKIPHAELTNRKFVLVPVHEIIPEHIHPELDKTISILMDECDDTSKVQLIIE